jgi:tetratricopeptide (TPR) repeat protein
MKVNKKKRALVFIMSALLILTAGIVFAYYQSKEKYLDPRVRKAREYYDKYDKLGSENDFHGVLSVLDSIELIYNSYPHYKNSYEQGVVHNNRAATYITMAIHYPDSSLSLDGINLLAKDSLLSLAKINIEEAIQFYEKWLEVFGTMTVNEIRQHIEVSFLKGMDSYSAKEQQKFLKERVEEYSEAKYETKRRLSVAYTNLGIVNRHRKNYKRAIQLYEKALVLWEHNLAARNNLNILQGKPLEKRNFIERMFPPERKVE